MSKKLPTPLLLPLLGLGSGCSSDHMEEDIIDIPTCDYKILEL